MRFRSEKFGEVRTVIIKNVVYFVGIDIAKALGYANEAKAISTHCKKSFKTSIDVSSQNGKSSTRARKTQEMLVICRSDIYRLIVKSKLPEAEEFENWLYEEVLPQIELTGGYIPIVEEDTPEMIMAKGLKVADETIKKKDAIIAEKDKTIAALSPQAEAYRKLMEAQGYLQFLDVSAMVEIGRTKLMDFLRRNKVLTKQSNYNIPYGRFSKNGMFKVIVEETRHGKIGSVTMVSPTGLNYIYKLINKKSMQDEFDLEKLLEVTANA